MDTNKCQCWLVKQNRQCSHKPIEGTSGLCSIHKDPRKRQNCLDMYGDASNPTTTKKTKQTKLNPTTTKKTKQTKQLDQYGSGEDLSDMPSDIIYSICKQFIDEDDYNAVENLTKTNKRIESICKPVYKAHLAKERENPTQISPEGHLLWTKPYDGSKPCGENKKFVTALLHRPDGLPAVIWKDGTREWWVDGELFRPEGKPYTVTALMHYR